MHKHTSELLGHQRADFDLIGRDFKRLILFKLLLAVFFAATTLIQDSRVVFVLSILAFLGILASYWLEFDLEQKRFHTERLRRATMLSGGLGFALSGTEVMEMVQRSSSTGEEAKKFIDPSYFASTSEPGPLRMAEMLQESAIWTTNLSKYAAREAWAFALVGIISLFVALVTLSAFFTPSQSQFLSRVVLALVPALASISFLGLALKYQQSKTTIERIVDKLESQLMGNLSQDQLILIFGDYNAAVQSMPLFRAGLYHRNQDALNRDYKKYVAERA